MLDASRVLQRDFVPPPNPPDWVPAGAGSWPSRNPAHLDAGSEERPGALKVIDFAADDKIGSCNCSCLFPSTGLLSCLVASATVQAVLASVLGCAQCSAAHHGCCSDGMRYLQSRAAWSICLAELRQPVADGVLHWDRCRCWYEGSLSNCQLHPVVLCHCGFCGCIEQLRCRMTLCSVR